MFKYFDISDFACKCCGQSQMDLDFVHKLDKAREIANTAFIINSGYRCSKHNVEIGSVSVNHPSGHAADIACDTGPQRIKILTGLIQAGFKRIGIRKDFIHVDDMDKTASCWLY